MFLGSADQKLSLKWTMLGKSPGGFHWRQANMRAFQFEPYRWFKHDSVERMEYTFVSATSSSESERFWNL
jgi:hypothetical protein